MVNMATRPFGESLAMGPNEEPVANYMRRSTYGNPKQAGWYGKNLVTIYSPSGVPFVVHRETAPAFQGFLGDLEASGYSIRPTESSGYNYRTIRGGTALSQHAFGNAIDINSLTNPMQSELKTDMPDNVRDMASKWGLEWGGDWSSTKDAMHFEWTGVPVVAGVGAVRGEEAVKQLQQSLAAQGLYDGEIDGVAGPATKAALTAYNAVNDGAQPQSQPAFNMASVSPTTAKLAGVMLAEARGEGREGMAGVGNVVINRTNTPGARFPKTIDETINNEFAKPLGPNDVSPEEWQQAVELAMGIQAGVVPDNTGGAVYFANPATSNANAYNLIKASGPVTATIGNHVYHAGEAPPAPRPSPVANIVQARDATQPNMAVRAPSGAAPPPVMSPTPPPFSLKGAGTTGQGAAAMATGTLPPAIPQPRWNPRRDPAGFMIDVNRPLIPNDDGSFSTEETITLNANEVGGPNMAVTIPTIVGGVRRSADDAISLFAQGQNPPVQWGFENFADAEAAAQSRTNAIAAARQTRGPIIGSAPIAPMQYSGRAGEPVGLAGSSSTSQGGSASAVGSLPAAIPTPRQRPDNNYFDVDQATLMDEFGNYVATGQTPGIPDPRPRPNMSIAPPPSPVKASQPAVKPIPASMAVEAPPAAPEKQEPSGVTFITPASISNLLPAQPATDIKAGEASESITSPMSAIEAAIQDFNAATPAPAPAPMATPVGAMDIRSPVQQQVSGPVTNMATAPPPTAGATIQTTQAPTMATASPGGGWFSKLFTPNTGGSKGFSPSGGGISPNGVPYKYGSGPLGTGYTQWQDSKGRTVTVAQNTFGQPGYLTGYS